MASTESSSKKPTPIIVRRTLTQAAKLTRVRFEPREEDKVVVRPAPTQQELPLHDNIILGSD